MGREIFDFKQFTIHQDRCAMKVCTDACLMGALVPIKSETAKILDIGSGTGLLSLMLAQRSQAIIDAVEVDINAAAQASQNFLNSPWSNRLNVYPSSIQKFAERNHTPYDLIICNPPFFENNLHALNLEYNIACHSSLLRIEELVEIAATMLHSKGVFAVMLPPFESAKIKELARHVGFTSYFVYNIRHREQSKIIREINLFKRQPDNHFGMEDVIIKDPDENYTSRFVQLLKSYYTIF